MLVHLAVVAKPGRSSARLARRISEAEVKEHLIVPLSPLTLSMSITVAMAGSVSSAATVF